MKTTEGFSKDLLKCKSNQKRCPKELPNGLPNGLSICCDNTMDCSYWREDHSIIPSCAL